MASQAGGGTTLEERIRGIVPHAFFEVCVLRLPLVNVEPRFFHIDLVPIIRRR